MNSSCLNCGNDVAQFTYCPSCGQKSSTHRYSLNHFVLHDVVHGVWHVDRGLPYTIKELFVRPGHSVRDYVQGKRMKHYNVISTLLIILAASLLISSYSKVDLKDVSNAAQVKGYASIARQYYKYIIISLIPLYALAGYLLFRKSKQNYVEYLVMYTYQIAAILIISMLFPVITLFYRNLEVLYYVKVIAPLLTLIYLYWFHYQYFSAFGYSKKELIVRSILVVVALSAINSLVNGVVNQIGLWLNFR